MRLSIETVSTAALNGMKAAAQQQDKAIIRSINITMVQIQRDEIAHVRSAFIIRREQFMVGTAARPGGAAARISPFANYSAGRFWARIAVQPPTGQKSGQLILPLFETGGTRRPSTPGAKSVAVPLLGRPARPSISQGVSPAFTFAGMHLVAFYGGKRLRKPRRGHRFAEVSLFNKDSHLVLPESERDSSKIQWKGRERTFLLPMSKGAPRGAVFQRIGPRRGDVREIYSFIEPPHMDRRLHFVEIAKGTAVRVLPAALKAEATRTFSPSGHAA